MLTTNLLPPEQKKYIEREEWSRGFQYATLLLISIGIIGITLLLPSYFDLIFRREDVAHILANEEATLADPAIKTTRVRVDQLSSRFRHIQEALSRPPRASDLTDHFFSKISPGIQLTSFAIRKTGDVEFNGTAATRANLLLFEDTLRDSGMFQEFLSPLSNIIREHDIQFTLKGVLKDNFKINP